jgi:hypothetical protein
MTLICSLFSLPLIFIRCCSQVYLLFVYMRIGEPFLHLTKYFVYNLTSCFCPLHIHNIPAAYILNDSIVAPSSITQKGTSTNHIRTLFTLSQFDSTWIISSGCKSSLCILRSNLSIFGAIAKCANENRTPTQ